MPRTRRDDQPGQIYHLIARGVNRRRIFMNPSDWFFFTKGLVRAARDDDLGILAFVLMPNHVHLVARRGVHPLGVAMGRLLGSHAQRFNRRHGRCGHLFQNRYKSILCDTDEYLMHLARYVHANPVRAGLTFSPATYPHSSYHWYTRPKPPRWAESRTLIEVLGGPRATRHFLERRDDASDLAILAAEDERREGGPEIESGGRRVEPSCDRAEPEVVLQQLSAKVERERGLPEGEIRTRNMDHSVTEARRRLTVSAVRDGRIRQISVAKFLGVSRSRVSRYLREPRRR